MLYALHEAAYYASTPLRARRADGARLLELALEPGADTAFGRTPLRLRRPVRQRHPPIRPPGLGRRQRHHQRQPVRVRPVVVWSSPWVKLLHFSRDPADMRRAGRRAMEPAVLIVAPLSGHYATLLRGTVEAFLQDHDVYISDWSNARDVPMLEGRFDFHDYIDHVRAMLRAHGSPAARGGGLPARAAGAGRRRPDGRGRRCQPSRQR